MSRAARPEKRAEWRRRFDRFERSNLSVRQFCDRESVSMASYYYWRRQLQATTLVSTCDVPASSPSLGDLFIPLQVTSASGRAVDRRVPRIKALLPNGVQLSMTAHDPQWFQVALATLAAVDAVRGDNAC